MIKIEVSYFALLKEQAQKNQEVIEFAGGTPRELWGKLAEAYGFTLTLEDIKVAINDEFVSWDTEIIENDRVVFIPPVAGG